MSRFPNPILRARFIGVSPIYELGIADAGEYAQTLVALFSGIVWLSRDTLTASHIRFFLESSGDSQFFTALQAPDPAFAVLAIYDRGRLDRGQPEGCRSDGNPLISPAPFISRLLTLLRSSWFVSP